MYERTHSSFLPGDNRFGAMWRPRTGRTPPSGRLHTPWRKRLCRLAAVVTAATLCLSTLSLSAAESPRVTLISTEIPAYIEEDSGAYRAFFDQAGALAGVSVEYRLMPWIRAVTRAERSTDLMIFPLTRNAEREARFTWLAKLSEVSIGFAAIDRSIDTLEEARTLSTVIVWRGSSMEAFLKEHGFTNLFGVSDTTTILSLLKQGRAAAWFGVLDEARSIIGQADDLTLGEPVHTDTVWLAGGKEHVTSQSADFVRMVDILRDRGLLRDLVAKHTDPGVGS